LGHKEKEKRRRLSMILAIKKREEERRGLSMILATKGLWKRVIITGTHIKYLMSYHEVLLWSR
jgi:hypothetical protein